MTPNATHRDGQRGELGALDASGFAVFESTTGAKFTVHALEIMPDARVASHLSNSKRVIGEGLFSFRVQDGKLIVSSTPTAAQCNAKRSAANQARLADAQRRSEVQS
jgi:hypothetical protein